MEANCVEIRKISKRYLKMVFSINSVSQGRRRPVVASGFEHDNCEFDLLEELLLLFCGRQNTGLSYAFLSQKSNVSKLNPGFPMFYTMLEKNIIENVVALVDSGYKS